MTYQGLENEFRSYLLSQIEEGQIDDSDLQNFSEQLIENKSSIPKLYRYSPANYNNIRALELNCLYLSPIGTMNDIFEGLSVYTDQETIQKLEQLGNLAYIKSFSETFDGLRMWSHYGDNYAGMCVAYDFANASELLLRHLFPVVYIPERFTYSIMNNYAADALSSLKRALEGSNAITEENALMNVMAPFLAKSDEWKNEREWRILYTYSQLYLTAENVGKENGFYYELAQKRKGSLYTKEELMCLPAPPITDVYLGPKMPERIKEHIREIAEKNSIQVHELHLHPERYALTE